MLKTQVDISLSGFILALNTPACCSLVGVPSSLSLGLQGTRRQGWAKECGLESLSRGACSALHISPHRNPGMSMCKVQSLSVSLQFAFEPLQGSQDFVLWMRKLEFELSFNLSDRQVTPLSGWKMKAALPETGSGQEAPCPLNLPAELGGHLRDALWCSSQVAHQL